MSNKWLFHFIIVCASELRMYIWYDYKIHVVGTYTCFRSTYLLITNIVCIIQPKGVVNWSKCQSVSASGFEGCTDRHILQPKGVANRAK